MGRDDSDADALAYFRAFPFAVVSDKDARRLAKFLRRRPAVSLMVQHLRRELSDRAMVPASRLIDELERMAFVNLADYGRVDAKGQLQVDLSRATYRSLAAINEVEVKERVVRSVPVKDDGELVEREDVVQRTTKIKFSKMDALDRLARIHGLYDAGQLDGASALDILDRAISRMKSKLAPQIEGVAT